MADISAVDIPNTLLIYMFRILYVCLSSIIFIFPWPKYCKLVIYQTPLPPDGERQRVKYRHRNFCQSHVCQPLWVGSHIINIQTNQNHPH